MAFPYHESTDAISFDKVSFAYADRAPIFNGLSLSLPQEATVVVGPNGCGKTTFLLLAGGRILPDEGCISLGGRDTRDFDNQSTAGAEQLNRICSFVYQNMEFESSLKAGSLLDSVWNDGRGSGDGDENLRKQVISVLELESEQSKGLDELSKGAMQRLILAFALFYGSRFLILDEPTFAMEHQQKQRALGLIKEMSENDKFPVYLAIHDIDQARRFGSSAVLFHRDGKIAMGRTDEILSDRNIENAYEAPLTTLYKREQLWREVLKRSSQNQSELEGKGNLSILE